MIFFLTKETLVINKFHFLSQSSYRDHSQLLVFVHIDVLMFAASLQVYPDYTMQFEHPFFFPLSHASVPALIESPH